MFHLDKATASLALQAGGVAAFAPSRFDFLLGVAIIAIAHYLAVRHKPKQGSE